MPVTIGIVERRIYLIRGQKVMLDSDLAELYQVPTKSLNLAVRRNHDRFPEDFMLQLTWKEFKNLRFQIETSSYGGRRYRPHAFTEQGVAMLSSVLKSRLAIQVNIAIMRAFVRLREIMATHKDLAAEIEKLKKGQKQHSHHIQKIFSIIQRLIDPIPGKTRGKIGFRT